MRLRSVRVRLLLLNMGVLALVLLALLAAVHYSVRGYLLVTIDRQLAHEANRAIQVGQRLRGNVELRAMMQARQRLPQGVRLGRRGFQAIRAFDTQGRSVDQFGAIVSPPRDAWDGQALALSQAGRTVYSTLTMEETPLRIYSAPLQNDGQFAGVIQVAYPLEELDHLLEGLTLILLVLSPLALLIAGLGGAFLTSRMLRPVRAITRAAAEISADNLSRRLPVAGEDEFSRLAYTFNGMVERLEKAFAQLEQSIEQERRFTADASHELRTPLTTIKANTSLALSSVRSPEAYRKALVAADGAADVMNRLVQDLLLLARTDSGQLTIDQQAAPISEIAQQAIALATHGEEQAGVQVAIADASLCVWGDSHHLTRLLVNLLENALRHTPPTGQVTLSAQRQDDMVRVSVADTGEGIPPEHLPHICERFYRADAARARQHGGTGLGLSICRSIVDAHHGALTIASTPGHGTTVTVLLPACAVSRVA